MNQPSFVSPVVKRVEQWDAWLAKDLEGAQTVIRCACAASEPALAEELIVKAGFSCGVVDELTGVRFDLYIYIERERERDDMHDRVPTTGTFIDIYIYIYTHAHTPPLNIGIYCVEHTVSSIYSYWSRGT